MANDPELEELEAMKGVFEILKGLKTEEAKIRVLNWNYTMLKRKNLEKPEDSIFEQQNLSFGTNIIDFSQFEEISDMFGSISANVNTEAEKALMVASYLQIKEGKKELISRDISTILTDMGHKVSNITSAINSLMQRRPQWMIQTKKEGNLKQSQKKYKVTQEGIKEAKRILSGINNSDS